MSDRKFGYTSTTVSDGNLSSLSNDELVKFNSLLLSESRRRGISENIELPPTTLLSPNSSPTRVTSNVNEFSEYMNGQEDTLIDEEVHSTGYKVLTYQRVVPLQGSVTKRKYEGVTVLDPPPQVTRSRTTTSLPVQQYATPVTYTQAPVQQYVNVPTYTQAPIGNNQVTTTTRRAIFPNGMNI